MIREDRDFPANDVRQEVPNALLDGEQLAPEDTPGLLGGGEMLGPEPQGAPHPPLELFKDRTDGIVGGVAAERQWIRRIGICKHDTFFE